MAPAAIFDLDGTLIDSRPAVLEAYRLAAAEFVGGTERLAAIPEGLLLAMRVIESASAVAGPAHAEACAARYDELYRLNSHRHVRVYDGVVEMLATLAAEGIELGIVTNKGRSRTPADVAGLDGGDGGNDLFRAIVSAEDTPERKPSPDPILFALEQADWRPEHSVYVGDGPHDAQSALAAGLQFIGAGWGYYDEDGLRGAGASNVLHEPKELTDTIRSMLAR